MSRHVDVLPEDELALDREPEVLEKLPIAILVGDLLLLPLREGVRARGRDLQVPRLGPFDREVPQASLRRCPVDDVADDLEEVLGLLVDPELAFRAGLAALDGLPEGR